MPKLNPTYRALLKEAAFTKEMLGSGATQIRLANYGTKGIYFQAFTSLCTGFERIGKLALMLDHYIDHGGVFPDLDYMRNKISHDLILLYQKSQLIIQKRSINFDFCSDLSDPIHQAILKTLSKFANGDRYSNIDLLVGNKYQSDPVKSWFETVDAPMYESSIPAKKKALIGRNAAIVSAMLGSSSHILHTAEDGTEVTTMEEASRRTGIYEAIAPLRQLKVLQIIRYWAELLDGLEMPARAVGKAEIPDFLEIFGAFHNDDKFFKGRKIWHGL